MDTVSEIPKPFSEVNSSREDLEVEKSVQMLVGQVERVFARSGIPRFAGERNNLCGISSELMERSAEAMGIESHIFGTQNIHKQLGGEIQKQKAFIHAFNIVKMGDNKYFLIDETFGQFITPDDKISQWDDLTVKTGNLEDHGIAYALARNGYVPLDDEALRDYLKVTTDSKNNAYAENITVEELFNNRKLHGFITRDQKVLDEYLSGKRLIDSIEDQDDIEA